MARRHLRNAPGSAAALAGGLAFGIGGRGTPPAGLLGGTPTAMGGIMLAGLGLGLVLQTVGPRWLHRWRRTTEPRG